MNQNNKEYLQYSYIGIYFVVAILFYWYLGKLIDDYFNITPIIQLLGASLGLFVGFYKLIIINRKLNESKSKKS
jgi:F0F1-type ATP synthase assembly protein I